MSTTRAGLVHGFQVYYPSDDIEALEAVKAFTRFSAASDIGARPTPGNEAEVVARDVLAKACNPYFRVTRLSSTAVDVVAMDQETGAELAAAIINLGSDDAAPAPTHSYNDVGLCVPISEVSEARKENTLGLPPTQQASSESCEHHDGFVLLDESYLAHESTVVIPPAAPTASIASPLLSPGKSPKASHSPNRSRRRDRTLSMSAAPAAAAPVQSLATAIGDRPLYPPPESTRPEDAPFDQTDPSACTVPRHTRTLSTLSTSHLNQVLHHESETDQPKKGSRLGIFSRLFGGSKS